MSTKKVSLQNDRERAIRALITQASLSHHALGLIGDVQEALDSVKNILSAADFSVVGNPDFYLLSREAISIDEIRRLRSETMGRPAQGAVRLFVISGVQIGEDAQNALLKILEDPPRDVRFILIVPTREALLQTVRSRLALVDTPDTSEDVALAAEGVAFLSASPAERLKRVAAIIEEKDRQSLNQLILCLEHALHEQVLRGQVDEATQLALHDLGRVRAMAYARSSSIKLLAEHLVAIMPHAGIDEKTKKAL
jgi:DNA polymerase III delta prime subunit